MRTLISELLLCAAAFIADPRTAYGSNLRWTAKQYFDRFKHIPVVIDRRKCRA